MKRRTCIQLSFLYLCLFLLTSCHSNDSLQSRADTTIDTTDRQKIVKVKGDSIKFTQVRVTEPPTKAVAFGGGGYAFKIARREWEAILTACKISAIDYNIRDFDFLGVGNPKNIGSIIDSTYLVSRMPLDTAIFSDTELKKIISRSYFNCQTSSSKSLVLKAIISGSLDVKNLDTALAAVIETSFTKKQDVNFTAKVWQKCEINTGWLAYYLQTGANLEKKKMYLKQLTTPGGLIIAKAIYINGLSLDIGLASALSLDLQAKLKANPTIKVGDLILKAGMAAKSDKTIHISADEPFIVYGFLMSGKKILL